MKKASYSWNELKSTFWFFPVLIISLSIVLAFIFLYLDSLIGYPKGPWQDLFISDADSARSILSTIAGVMIGGSRNSIFYHISCANLGFIAIWIKTYQKFHAC